MQEYIKAINAFLSIFNFSLPDDINTSIANLDKYKIIVIVDRVGNVVGTITSEENLGYKININNSVFGNIEAIIRKREVDCLREEDPNMNIYNIEYALSEPKDKTAFDILSGEMEIIAISDKNGTTFGFKNSLLGWKDNLYTQVFSFESNYPTFDYAAVCDEATLYFSGQPNNLIPVSLCYSDKPNHKKFEIKNITKDKKGNSIKPFIVLDHSIDTCLSDTGVINTHRECSIEDIDCSLITFFYDNLIIYDCNFYELIEKIREYTKFGKVCLLDNILSLCSNGTIYTDDELNMMYGFIPNKLKHTPNMLSEGVVSLPNLKPIYGKKKPKKQKKEDKTEGTK